jgi:hypothetical protein
VNQLNLLHTINGFVLIIGIPTIVGLFIYIGRKLQILDNLEITVNKIKGNVKVVSDYLAKSHSKFNQKEIQAYSPLTLTLEGNKLITSLGFDNIFAQNKDDFFRCISSENPKLKYDVELYAIKSISALQDKDYMKFLKVYFYNNPDRNIENTAPTLGVYIRDKYLAEHPEITE